MTAKEKQLWAAYRSARTVENRNALAEHYFPKLPGIIGACCPRASGPAVADDDVGAASVRLLRAIETYRFRKGGASFITKLRHAVVSAVRNERLRGPAVGQTGRRERGQTCSTVPLDGLSFAAPEKQADAERREDLQQMTAAVLKSKRHVDTIIATFKPQERRVLQLVHFEGMTLTECAKKMRLSVGRISQIRKAALRKLRKALEV